LRSILSTDVEEVGVLARADAGVEERVGQRGCPHAGHEDGRGRRTCHAGKEVRVDVDGGKHVRAAPEGEEGGDEGALGS
jgi:hypothetical protein